MGYGVLLFNSLIYVNFLKLNASLFQKSVVQAVLDVTNERPWLWAVFIVVVLLPIVLVIAYCCVGSSAKVSFLFESSWFALHAATYLVFFLSSKILTPLCVHEKKSGSV